MSNQRHQTIMKMLEAWKETDSYEEELEKTTIIEELLAQLTNQSVEVQPSLLNKG